MKKLTEDKNSRTIQCFFFSSSYKISHSMLFVAQILCLDIHKIEVSKGCDNPEKQKNQE
jgi:hypothetical protein